VTDAEIFGHTEVVSQTEIQHFDLIVIGSGPAGEKGAAQAAYFGKKVALIDSGEFLGGVCTNSGTLPSKALRESAVHLSGLRRRGLGNIAFGLNSQITVEDLFNRTGIAAESERERIRNSMARHKVQVFQGVASFESPTKIALMTSPNSQPKILESQKILLAPGTKPRRPKNIPFNPQNVWDTESLLKMPRVPQSLTIIGGGVIACEYASIFASLGVEVTLVESKSSLLPFLDSEVRELLVKELFLLGISFHLGAEVAQCDVEGKSVFTRLSNGVELSAEALLYAAGREGNVAQLRLDRAGLQVDARGLIKVNENFQTSQNNIYAAGDIIGFPALASVSMDQGRLAICHAFEWQYRRTLPAHIPMAIYTIPEVSCVGETEESLRARSEDFEVGKTFFKDNARALIQGDGGGMLKILFSPKTFKILGVHVVGERASEIISPGLVALRAGLGIHFLIETVWNFPTLCEAYKMAAYDGLGRLSARGIDTRNLLENS
jgi:NAD(P) transhydrogenase